MFTEEIKKQTCDESVLLEPRQCFDKAIIGVRNFQVVYDFEKLILALMDYEKFSLETALEWYYYNTERALPYMGKYPPLIKGNETEES